MPRQTQLAVGPLVAAVGAVILIVSLFLDWYEGVTGFTVFEFLDLLLLLLGLATIASLAGGLGLVKPATSPAVSLAVAVFTIFVVLSQIINDPPAVVGPGPEKDIGIWLALSGSALMVAGAVLGYASISLAFEPRAQRSDRDATGVDAPAPSGQDGPRSPAVRRRRTTPRPGCSPIRPPDGDRTIPRGPERAGLRRGRRARATPRESRRRPPSRWAGCSHGAVPCSSAAGWAA